MVWKLCRLDVKKVCFCASQGEQHDCFICFDASHPEGHFCGNIHKLVLPINETLPISPLLFLSKQIQKEAQLIVRQGILLRLENVGCLSQFSKMSNRQKDFVCQISMVHVSRSLMVSRSRQDYKDMVEDMLTRHFGEVVWTKNAIAKLGQGAWSLASLEWEVKITNPIPSHLA
jgi:hypothetical protein